MDIDKGFKHNTVTVNGVPIHYVTIGKGKPLVFVHGWTNDWQGWIPMARELSSSYSLYLLDLPGYGDSGSLPEYSGEILAGWINDFCKEIELHPYAVIGASMGTFIVAYCVNLYPKLTERTILLDAIFYSGPVSFYRKIFPRFFRFVQNKPLFELIVQKVVSSRLYTYSISKYLNMYNFNKELIETYNLKGRKKTRKEAFTDFGVMNGLIQTEDLLAGTKQKILIATGKYDKISKIKDAQFMLKDVKGDFSFSEIDDAGHLAPLEKPKEVAEVIKKFLKS